MSEVLPGKNGIHQALFEHASMGILVAAADGRIVMANRFLLRQFGYDTVEELLNKPVEHLIPTRYHKKHTHHRNHYTHNPEQRAMGIGMDLFAVKKNGDEFPVEISLGHYKSEDQAFVIAFISDITQRKKIEADVIAQKEELKQINKQFEELNNNLEKTVEKRTSQLKKLMLQIEASRDDLSTALNK